MPNLPARDELVSLNRFSSWGLWNWYNFWRLLKGGYGVNAAFHFWPVFTKKKILWKRRLWWSKIFHQRVFSDKIWRISKFQFWRRILDIYRQPLLKSFGNFFRSIYRTTWNTRLVDPSFHLLLNTTSFRCTWNFERFHMTSWRPCWCSKTMKRRPCWCIKEILWELSSFLM